MMRQILLLALFLSTAQAAVLLRFINTVPTRTATDSCTAYGTTPCTSATVIDRVGLEYYAQSSNGAINSATLVWTYLLQTSDLPTGAVSPYAWYFAMPPLRAYHTAASPEVLAVDKPVGTNDGSADALTQEALRFDGVGGYLSFAPGTYKLDAYAAAVDGTTTTAGTATPKALSGSAATFTFADNQVYTIIAYGDAKFAASGTGSTVKLALLQESTAPTTFGKASLRFFHAINAQASSGLDFYDGGSFSTANKIATGVAYGAVSNYVDVTPGLAREYAVAVSGTSVTPLITGTPVQRDVRAGLRATVICAAADASAAVAFCRAIPSRVVAYVRLVNDLAGVDSLVQGRFGAQKLSETALHLYASYEFPRPEEVAEISQVFAPSVNTNHPALVEGLYPVLLGVAPGTVTGYGEVFVPVYIMDFAVRFVVGTAVNVATNGKIPTTSDFAQRTAWFYFAPMLKRVNLIVKTDGFATLSGKNTVDPYPFVGSQQKGLYSAGGSTFTGAVTNDQNLNTYLTLDQYFEPGQFYTLFATASSSASAGTVTYYQQASNVNFFFTVDLTTTILSQGIAAGSGLFTLIPFYNAAAGGASQSFNAPITGNTMTLQASGSSSAPITVDFTGTVGANQAKQALGANGVAGQTALTTVSTPLTLIAGTYSWLYSLGSNNVCTQNIPGPGTLTITAGGMVDLFVLGVYKCAIANDATKLKVVTQNRVSANATGNGPFTTTTTRAIESPRRAVFGLQSIPFYGAASTSSVSFFALIACIFAFLLAL